ncbi:MAG: 50S ribosomal protein L3 [FCB group bacterium]|jgi:large subunit ribosomal protein L3|nr:50S ribosomal protein L3 [FCB group bacterium]
MVSGLLGKKVGMTRVFGPDGRQYAVTVLEVGPCTVVQRKSEDKDGYEAVQLGFGTKRVKLFTKPELGHFKKHGVEVQRHLIEFPVAAGDAIQAGDQIKADIFKAGDRIDVAGTSKGKGFQGVQKRHGFKGGPGGHGSMFHRRPGAIGQSSDPSKVFKGMRMAGHMGNKRITVQSLEVLEVDPEKNLVIVRGAVPGANGGILELKHSVKGS